MPELSIKVPPAVAQPASVSSAQLPSVWQQAPDTLLHVI